MAWWLGIHFIYFICTHLNNTVLRISRALLFFFCHSWPPCCGRQWLLSGSGHVMSKTFQSLVLKVVKVYKKLVYVWLAWYTDAGRNHGVCVCVLFLNCGEGGYHVPWSQCVCAVSTAGCPCSHHGGEKGGGELTGNWGVTIPCCLWSADVLTIWQLTGGHCPTINRTYPSPSLQVMLWLPNIWLLTI